MWKGLTPGRGKEPERSCCTGNSGSAQTMMETCQKNTGANLCVPASQTWDNLDLKMNDDKNGWYHTKLSMWNHMHKAMNRKVKEARSLFCEWDDNTEGMMVLEASPHAESRGSKSDKEQDIYIVSSHELLINCKGKNCNFTEEKTVRYLPSQGWSSGQTSIVYLLTWGWLSKTLLEQVRNLNMECSNRLDTVPVWYFLILTDILWSCKRISLFLGKTWLGT